VSSTSALGPHLRELRLQSGIALEEISRVTRIPTRYLDALEAEQFASLPAPVFVRGFIRAYCHALGQSAEPALSLYRPDGEPVPGPARPPMRASARGPRGRGAVLVSLGLLVSLGGALLGVTLLLQSGRPVARAVPSDGHVRAERDAVTSPSEPGTPGPTAASGSTPGAGWGPSALPATVSAGAERSRAPEPPAPGTSTATPSAAPTPSVTVTPPPPPGPAAAPATPSASSPPRTPEPAAPAAPMARARDGAPIVGAVTASAPYRLIARTVEPTWIRVRMEDGRLSEETIPAGESREWVSNAPFVVTVGNAGGVSLELNGEKLPPLGGKGVVVPRLVLPPTQQ
jgi:cytoskeleton protein RodZ